MSSSWLIDLAAAILTLLVAAVELSVRHSRSKRITLRFVTQSGGVTQLSQGSKMQISATIDNGVIATAAFTDAKGNPVTPVPAPSWSLSDGAPATITPAIDGLTCAIAPTGIGACTLTVVTGTLIGSLDIQFGAGQAAYVVVSGEVVSVIAG